MWEISDFKALTFDCYGTLIDWEQGIWQAISPILAAHGLLRPRESVLANFAALEHEAETARPGDPYPDILRAVYAGMAGQYGMPVVAHEKRPGAMNSAGTRARSVKSEKVAAPSQ